MLSPLRLRIEADKGMRQCRNGGARTPLPESMKYESLAPRQTDDTASKQYR
jgi:hypothetical protein